MSIIFLFLISLGVFLVWIKKRKSQHRLPSGPMGLPYIGHMLQLARGPPPHIKFAHWAEQYGKLYTIRLGSHSALVINDQKLIRQLFSLMPATGRFRVELLDQLLWYGSYGIGLAEGKTWLELRQFTFRTLGQFGFGRPSIITQTIRHVAQRLCDWIDNNNFQDKVLYLNDKLKTTTGNLLWTMIAGEREVLGESKIVNSFHQLLPQMQKLTNNGVVFFPWIKYVAPNRTGYAAFEKNCANVREHIESSFQIHKMTRQSGDSPRDMIDAYIEKVENCMDSQSALFGETGWKHSMASVVMLKLAGTDATGSMLSWLIFYLSVYQNVQKELHLEIDSVLGRDREATLCERDAMPYMEAVIFETLRLATGSMFGGIHLLTEDLTFDGYHLPKGMLLLPNLYFVNHDKSIWGDAHNFRPSRFLEKGGDSLKDFVITFSSGKRKCPGEQLGKDILFLFATKLFQRYTFSVDPRKDINEYMEPTLGIMLYPKNLGVIATLRPQNI